MSQALEGRGGRVLGRSLLTVANVITAAAPLAADWNDSHIFNERWPAHARFHAVTALAMTAALSSANIWSLWSSGSGQASERFFAAAVPVAYWAPFFLAPVVPGTAVDDPPYPVKRVAGVPVSLLGAAATTATAAAGWFIDRRSTGFQAGGCECASQTLTLNPRSTSHAAWPLRMPQFSVGLSRRVIETWSRGIPSGSRRSTISP